MLVFKSGCGIEPLADGLKLRCIWKMHDVWPFLLGQIEQQLVWIASLAHCEYSPLLYRANYTMGPAQAEPAPIVDCL